MSKEEVCIVAACRTPIGSFGGVFKDIKAPELSVPVMKALVERVQIDPGKIDDVIWGCAYQRVRNETNIARVAAIRSGIPDTVPGVTVQRVCTSAMWAIVSGVQAIRAGDAEIILAGGVESMSTVPYTLDTLRWGARLQHVEVYDALWDGLTCLGIGPPMGITAENLVQKYGIGRDLQDELAYTSHMRASRAVREGRFQDEIIPVPVPQKRGVPLIVEKDEGPRDDTSIDKLAKLRPIFKEGGTVTAGNASTINDGAAGVIVMSESKVPNLA